MSRSPWWAFDKDGPEDEQDDELATLEKTALDAVQALARQADEQPDKVLVIAGALRKIHTVAGSKAQTLGLRIATVKGGRRV